MAADGWPATAATTGGACWWWWWWWSPAGVLLVHPRTDAAARQVSAPVELRAPPPPQRGGPGTEVAPYVADPRGGGRGSASPRRGDRRATLQRNPFPPLPGKREAGHAVPRPGPMPLVPPVRQGGRPPAAPVRAVSTGAARRGRRSGSAVAQPPTHVLAPRLDTSPCAQSVTGTGAGEEERSGAAGGEERSGGAGGRGRGEEGGGGVRGCVGRGRWPLAG